ncbi:hypothetical protein [Cognatazoarcus halotolerans]|uniref:hypothetical protein n=1 Tax=Cognatazoarcus halotolerans TaxID=2686016 RepID=UPI0013597541|nr:hypothetical protein [Cognatazoarcus halotolerans]MCB1900716.1 hypothetical protein [Rhodocyclaceae bacterium]MCP5308445.1 hypothetical protein [Zoogloeaceae bacterium]
MMTSTRSARLILLHKQSTSARVRFLRLPAGILAFMPLPAQAELRDERYSATVEAHPAAIVREAETRLGLAEGSIQPEAAFRAWVDTAEGDVPVLLGVFTTVDPPADAAARLKGRFMPITEARELPEIEQLLLRRAYEHVLG